MHLIIASGNYIKKFKHRQQKTEKLKEMELDLYTQYATARSLTFQPNTHSWGSLSKAMAIAND